MTFGKPQTSIRSCKHHCRASLLDAVHILDGGVGIRLSEVRVAVV